MSIVDEQFYWVMNLLLSAGIAKAEGLNQQAAVQRTARLMRDRTRCEGAYLLARNIIKAPRANVMNMVESVYEKMQKDGLA